MITKKSRNCVRASASQNSPANDDHPRHRNSDDVMRSEPTVVAANDDWIDLDLPIKLPVLKEEVFLLDAVLRSQILGLFEGERI